MNKIRLSLIVFCGFLLNVQIIFAQEQKKIICNGTVEVTWVYEPKVFNTVSTNVTVKNLSDQTIKELTFTIKVDGKQLNFSFYGIEPKKTKTDWIAEDFEKLPKGGELTNAACEEAIENISCQFTSQNSISSMSATLSRSFNSVEYIYGSDNHNQPIYNEGEYKAYLPTNIVNLSLICVENQEKQIKPRFALSWISPNGGVFIFKENKVLHQGLELIEKRPLIEVTANIEVSFDLYVGGHLAKNYTLTFKDVRNYSYRTPSPVTSGFVYVAYDEERTQDGQSFQYPEDKLGAQKSLAKFMKDREMQRSLFSIRNVRVNRISQITGLEGVVREIVNKKYKKDDEYKKLMEEGNQLFKSKDYQLAKSKFQQALEKKPNDQEATQKIQEVEKIEKEKQEEAEQKGKEEKKDTESEEVTGEDEEIISEEEQYRQEYEEAQKQKEAERIQRKQEYDRLNKEIEDGNTELAIQLAIYTLGLAYKLGKDLIYKDMGFNGIQGSYKKNAPYFGTGVGYTLTSAPMLTNSEIEDFNGNNFSYTRKTINHQTVSMDLEGFMEFWPFYGDEFGFGFVANGAAGLGVESSKLEANGGFAGYFGKKHFKLLTSYRVGVRSFSHFPWISPQELGSGKSQYKYQRLSVGTRFTFPAQFQGATRAHIDISALFEQPDFNTASQSTSLLQSWNNGLNFTLEFENRIRFFVETFWNSTRHGQTEYPMFETSNQGVFLKFGAIRKIDIYAEPDFIKNIEANQQMIERKPTLSFTLQGSLSQLASIGDTTFTTSPNISSGIQFGKDFRLLSNFSFVTALGFDYGIGGTIKVNPNRQINLFGQNLTAGSETRVNLSTINIPLGIRVHTKPKLANVYWLQAAINNRFVVLESFSQKTTGNYFQEDKPKFEKIEVGEKQIRGRFSELDLGAGVDFVLTGGTRMRVGLYYRNTLGSILPSTSPYELSLSVLSLNFGFLF